MSTFYEMGQNKLWRLGGGPMEWRAGMDKKFETHNMHIAEQSMDEMENYIEAAKTADNRTTNLPSTDVAIARRLHIIHCDLHPASPCTVGVVLQLQWIRTLHSQTHRTYWEMVVNLIRTLLYYPIGFE